MIGSRFVIVVVGVLSIEVIILLRLKKIVLLHLCSGCLCFVFLTMTWVGMQSVFVAFPGHTYLPFYKHL